MLRRITTGNGLTIVGRKDKKSVYLASNCDSSELMSTGQTWNKDTEGQIVVPQPFLTDRYNKGMGGVGRTNQNIATYRMAFKTERLWTFFACISDMIVQNS